MRCLVLFGLLLSALPAYAGPKDQVRAFFDDFVALRNAFDPSVADLYLPEAKMISLRDGRDLIEIPFAEYRESFLLSLPVSKAIGDVSRFENVAVKLHGQGFRITATRYAAVKCATDPKYHLDVVRVGREWRITEEYIEAITLTRCQPSAELGKALETARSQVADRLPIQVDDETRLEAIELSGANLILRYWLPKVSPNTVDYRQFFGYLRQNGLRSICKQTPQMRALTERGATVRLSYTDAKRRPLVNVDVSPGTCAYFDTLEARKPAG
ncbi:MAG: hypothetical protein AAGD06_06280 [Acidobacteriota bacterium]